jgi:hypothetical protein
MYRDIASLVGPATAFTKVTRENPKSFIGQLVISNKMASSLVRYSPLLLAEINYMRLSSALFVASGLAVLFAALPFLSTFAAAAVASAGGCTLNEGSAHPCIIFGFDAGETLYVMAVAFWLFIFTWLYLPVAALLGIAGFSVLMRGRGEPARNRKVGVVFWMLMIAAMILPVDQIIALGLALAAFFISWRQKRSAARHA